MDHLSNSPEDSDNEGQMLLERGRHVREQRRNDRSFKSRLSRALGHRPSWLKGLIIGTAAVATLLAIAIFVDVISAYGRIHPGVRIGEVKVGAATPDTAAARIEEVFSPRLDEPLVVLFEDLEWPMDSTELSVDLQTEELIADAMAVGRSGSFVQRATTRARLWVEPETIPVRVSAEETAVAGMLDGIAEAVERDPRDAAVVIEGTSARLESAVLGVQLRRDALRTAVLSGFTSLNRDVEVEVELTPVRVTDEGVAQALRDVQAMLAGPVVVRHDSDEWEFSAVDVAGWIDFREVAASSNGSSGVATMPPSPDDSNGTASEVTTAPVAPDQRYELQAFISADHSREQVLSRTGSAGKAPVDARFKVGGGSVAIIPSEDGVGPDVDALAQELTRVLTTGPGRTVELKTRRIEPERTTEKAQAMGIRERMATYTTTFSSTNKPRVNNIHTLSDALDGTLVAPGAVFSFNETIGPRTAAKGYQEAAAIVGGKLVPSLGGGICQVGTTIFNTVFESGLPVVERRNHSFYLSTYPDGRDATIAWGGPDFKFKNDTGHWILIATGYSNSSVTVSLYGTDPGYTVKASKGPFTDVVPFPVKEIEDSQLPVGTRVVEDGGVNGRKIVVTRTVTKAGTVVREDSFRSTYRAKEQVVRVGTKVEESVVTTGTVSP